MNERQREMATHALGHPKPGQTPYRNRYVCDAECPDGVEWMRLVDAGLATVRNLGELSGGMDVFMLTEAGKKAVHS